MENISILLTMPWKQAGLKEIVNQLDYPTQSSWFDGLQELQEIRDRQKHEAEKLARAQCQYLPHGEKERNVQAHIAINAALLERRRTTASGLRLKAEIRLIERRLKVLQQA